jgi:hypothetical protein
MVQILGPIQGVTFNARLDCASIASFGLIVRAAVDSNIRASVSGARSIGILTTAYPVSGYASTPYPVGTIQTEFDRCFVSMPDIANTVAFEANGDATGMSTWNCTFKRLYIYLPPTQACFALKLGVADSNKFDGLLIFGTNPVTSGGAPVPVASQFGVIFDYSANSIFPSSNVFDSPDVGWGVSASSQWINSGTPATFAQPNKIANLSGLNRGVYPKSTIENLIVDLPQRLAVLELLNRASAIGNGFVLATIRTAGIYKVDYMLAVKTAATTGNIPVSVNWDGEGAALHTLAQGTFALNTAGAILQGSITAYVRANGTIRMDLPFTSVTGSPLFDFVHTVTRLS